MKNLSIEDIDGKSLEEVVELLENNYGNSTVYEYCSNKFNFETVDDFKKILRNKSKNPEDNSSKTNEPLTEDKFDKNVIPTTKTWGIAGSILVGIGIFFNPNGGIIEAVIYSLIGIMSTLGLCVLLEGFSTLIKLQRKLTEQNEKILKKMK